MFHHYDKLISLLIILNLNPMIDKTPDTHTYTQTYTHTHRDKNVRHHMSLFTTGCRHR